MVENTKESMNEQEAVSIVQGFIVDRRKREGLQEAWEIVKSAFNRCVLGQGDKAQRCCFTCANFECLNQQGCLCKPAHYDQWKPRQHMDSKKQANKQLMVWLKEQCPDTVIMDDFDDCVLGVCERFGQDCIVAYDKDKIISKLKKQGASYEEALEWFEFNQIGAWVGDGTPCFITKKPRGIMERQKNE